MHFMTVHFLYDMMHMSHMTPHDKDYFTQFSHSESTPSLIEKFAS